MTRIENDRTTSPPSDSVVRVFGICICGLVYRLHGKRLELVDGMELANVHHLDLNAAFRAITHVLPFDPRPGEIDDTLAVEEVKPEASSSAAPMVDLVIDTGGGALGKEGDFPEAIAPGLGSCGRIQPSPDGAAEWGGNYARFLESLETLHRRIELDLRSLNLPESEYSAAYEELAGIMQNARSTAQELFRTAPHGSLAT